jgi:hypothetical protein
MKGRYVAHREAKAVEQAVAPDRRGVERAAAVEVRAAEAAPALSPPMRLSQPWRDLSSPAQQRYRPIPSPSLEVPPAFPQPPTLRADPKAGGSWATFVDQLNHDAHGGSRRLAARQSIDARKTVAELRKVNSNGANELLLQQYQIAMSCYFTRRTCTTEHSAATRSPAGNWLAHAPAPRVIDSVRSTDRRGPRT